MRYSILLTALLAVATLPVQAEETSIKQDAKDAAHKVGEAGKKVGKEVAKTAVKVGHATRDGAKAFAKTIKEGDSGSGANSSTSSSLHQK